MDSVKEEHLVFLDRLRESGEVNMLGSAPYLQEMYPDLSYGEAKKVVTHWIRTFSKRHPDE